MAVQPEDQDNVVHYFTDEFENHMDTTISEFEPGTPESTWRDFFKYVDRIGMETPENTSEHKDVELELASKDETPMEDEEFEMEEPSEERKEDGYMADDEAGPIRARVPNWFYAGILHP